MTFTELGVSGAWLIDADVFPDDRGAFLRLWTPEEMAARGLEPGIAQVSVAQNHLRGTIRGLHYQVPPFAEAKLIRVSRGAVADVALDLRPDSPTYRQWTSVELSAENRRAVYVPRGVAHGYQTLVEDTDVLYFVSASYRPEFQRGIRWNDPAFAIDWPLGPPTAISARDRAHADYAEDAPRPV